MSTLTGFSNFHYSRATVQAYAPMLLLYSHAQAQFAKAYSLVMRLALTCSFFAPLLWHTVSPCPPSFPLSHSSVTLYVCMCVYKRCIYKWKVFLCVIDWKGLGKQQTEGKHIALCLCLQLSCFSSCLNLCTRLFYLERTIIMHVIGSTVR